MLDISFGLIIMTAVIFFILVAVLNGWLYRPLLNFMQEREESIRKDMEDANKNSSGSTKLLQEADEIIAKAKAEAASIKNEIINEAKEYANRVIEEKKEELAKEYESFKIKLKEDEENIKNTLLSQTPLFKEAIKAKFSKLQ
ncbi:hypothetical protein [Nitrosophilus kaiyonis]|uniref:F0F1 ATP synthase subunit B family protein n=1 Tax=Nitrosophilus kaiyonis TaxID=2930200 RepID=UPI00249387A6|nr:hypothetical protein [Nitrosophilus kaiyonis]